MGLVWNRGRWWCYFLQESDKVCADLIVVFDSKPNLMTRHNMHVDRSHDVDNVQRYMVCCHFWLPCMVALFCCWQRNNGLCGFIYIIISQLIYIRMILINPIWIRPILSISWRWQLFLLFNLFLSSFRFFYYYSWIVLYFLIFFISFTVLLL